MSEAFARALRAAVRKGLAAALLVDREGRVIERAGNFDKYDEQAFVDLATGLRGDDGLADRLLAGEQIPIVVGGHEGRISIAEKFVFVIAVIESPEQVVAARALHDAISIVIRYMRENASYDAPVRGDSSGPPSGPAGAPAIELWVTPGVRAKA